MDNLIRRAAKSAIMVQMCSEALAGLDFLVMEPDF